MLSCEALEVTEWMCNYENYLDHMLTYVKKFQITLESCYDMFSLTSSSSLALTSQHLISGLMQTKQDYKWFYNHRQMLARSYHLDMMSEVLVWTHANGDVQKWHCLFPGHQSGSSKNSHVRGNGPNTVILVTNHGNFSLAFITSTVCMITTMVMMMIMRRIIELM